MEQVVIEIPEVVPQDVVMEVKEVEVVGKYTGQCKWFNDKLGYGFVTICDGDDKGKDIFVHHTGVKPLNSNYKTLRKGEYIQFNVIDGINGLQAVDVRGIGGGPLMCDFVSTKKLPPPPPPTNPRVMQQPYNQKTPGQWQTVTKKAKYAPRNPYPQPSGQHTGGKRSYKQAVDV